MSHSGPMTNDDDAEIRRYTSSRRISSILLSLGGQILKRTGSPSLAPCKNREFHMSSYKVKSQLLIYHIEQE